MNVESALDNLNPGSLLRSNSLENGIGPLAGSLAGNAFRRIGIVRGDRVLAIQSPPSAGTDPTQQPQSGPWDGILSQLMGVLNEIMQAIGGILGSSNQTGQLYTSATAGSTGDPHLAFDGTTALGGHTSAHFDSMTGHQNLLHSDSLAGGYGLSTEVTAPGSNGVTYNALATVSTDYGTTQVSLAQNGNATLIRNGQSQMIANGQTFDLGNGETVSRDADGALSVSEANGQGGTIMTKLSENGTGIDANVTAQNVDLDGFLVNRSGPQP